METPKPYISINCWKCKAQNNAAVAIHCRVCRAYLAAAEENENPLSHGFADHPAFKGYLLLAVAVLGISVALIYFYRPKPISPAYIAGTTASKEIVLPPDSWYNNSWWSYVSGSPSVRQILRKYEEAMGETPSLDAARTFSLSGKMSHAVGTCFEQFCVDEAKRRIAEQQARMPPAYRWSPPGATRIEPAMKPEVSDKYDQLSFIGIGNLEFLVKMPAKTVKKATVINPHDQTHRRIQVVEYFNGMDGRRITEFFDASDNKVKSEVDLMDAQELELAKFEQTSMLGKDFDIYTDMELRGLEKVNERVAFAVTAKNRKGEREKFYFDVVTGFVIKMDTPLDSMYFQDYRPWGKGMLPYTVYVRHPEIGGFHSWMKIEIAEWKIGDHIEDSVFEIPSGN